MSATRTGGREGLLDRIRTLPTVPVWHPTDPNAAAVLGVSRDTAYSLARAGELPGVLRVGHRLVVGVPALLRALGEDT